MRLRQWLTGRGHGTSGSLYAAETTVSLAGLEHHSSLAGRLEELRGRTVLILVRDQLLAALALIELDGVAGRVVLCPPDLSQEHLPGVIASSGADSCVCDSARRAELPERLLIVTAGTQLTSVAPARGASHDTEWVLLTSGTTGAPKLVLHTLASLSSALTGGRALAPSEVSSAPIVWSTFYDIRRYGGLQIFLRALRDGSLVLSSTAEPVPEFLARAAAAAVTHISGTPSHWRRALMSGASGRISPRYVRLSGEIADQAILDSLRAAYPRARVAHAFASTEAGVAFEVQDGLAGFPAGLAAEQGANRAMGQGRDHGGEHGAIPETLDSAPVEMQISGDVLRVRSPGNAMAYLGKNAPSLKDPDGFVTTGDRVELRNGRYYFVGRSGGVINVGGLKVHPEEVEAVINSHPWVRMSLVRARRSSITGSIVVADIVLLDERSGPCDRPPDEALRREISAICRRLLAPHKVPTRIGFVPALEMSASGKLVRPDA